MCLTRRSTVETVRRYSKLPHLWGLSKRLASWLEPSELGKETEDAPTLPHVHKLDQRLSDETRAALVQDYHEGASLADLQRTYSLGRSSVQRLLREARLRRRRKSLTDIEVAVLVELYESGLTIREIAAEQRLAKTTVQPCTYTRRHRNEINGAERQSRSNQVSPAHLPPLRYSDRRDSLSAVASGQIASAMDCHPADPGSHEYAATTAQVILTLDCDGPMHIPHRLVVPAECNRSASSSCPHASSPQPQGATSLSKSSDPPISMSSTWSAFHPRA